MKSHLPPRQRKNYLLSCPYGSEYRVILLLFGGACRLRSDTFGIDAISRFTPTRAAPCSSGVRVIAQPTPAAMIEAMGFAA